MTKGKKVVIGWSPILFDTETLKDITHHVSSVHLTLDGIFKVTIEKGLNVEQVSFTAEHAEKIGFINLKALIPYCK